MKALSVSLGKNPNGGELFVQRVVRYGWQSQALISEAGLISLDVRETFLMQSDVRNQDGNCNTKKNQLKEPQVNVFQVRKISASGRMMAQCH